MPSLTCSSTPPDGTARIRVLLVDDHLLFRKALKNLLESYPEIEIVGEAADGLDVLDLIQAKQPHIVCMDRCLPIFSGIETTRQLRQHHPHIKVIGLSASDDVAIIHEILDAGAAAYLSKQDVHEKLMDLIRAVHSPVEPLLP